MAKMKRPSNQLEPTRRKDLPEYGELLSIMQNETASILTDYVRQYIGAISQTPEPGSGIFINFDRVQASQEYQGLAWYDLYAEVERDPHVNAILTSAKLNVAGLGWDVDPFVEGNKRQASTRDQKIADFTKDALTKCGHLPQHIFNLLDGIGKGFAVSEIIWDIQSDGVRVKTLLNRPQRRFQFDAVDRSLKVRTIAAPYYGEPLPDKKFIVYRPSAQWENPFGDAADQSLYWMWLFKRTAMKFWLKHLEVGAASVPIVKHPQSANKEMKDEALEIAKMVRNGAYGRLPDNFELIWAEATNAIDSATAYQNFIRECNDEMTKCVQGQTLTTEASSQTGTGTRALGAVHQQTQDTRDIFRAHTLEATLNATLIKWLVDFNFADVDGYPSFRFDLEDPQDLKGEAVIVKALTDAGYDFDENELSEKFNYTITKKQPKPVPPALAKAAGIEADPNAIDENIDPAKKEDATVAD